MRTPSIRRRTLFLLGLLPGCLEYHLPERPDDCEVDVSGTGPIDLSPTCPSTIVADPWNVVEAWTTPDFGVLINDEPAVQVGVTPVVGHLLDTDEDGTIDDNDAPNVALVAFIPSFSDAMIVVLDGESGEAVRWFGPVAPVGGIAIADVDLNGLADIVAFDEPSLQQTPTSAVSAPHVREDHPRVRSSQRAAS
jgi:hypothetical protein